MSSTPTERGRNEENGQDSYGDYTRKTLLLAMQFVREMS